MYQYNVKFSVDGRRTEETVSANSSMDAKKIIQARYGSSKLTFWSVTKI